jgi:glycogen(starch) synthase
VRVLFWSHSFWPEIGGVQVFAANLLPALRERGYEIEVVTAQIGADQSIKRRYKGITIHRLPFRAASSYSNIDQLVEVRQQVAQLKRTFAPDLVHMNYAACLGNFFHLTTLEAHPSPSLVTLHGMSTQHNWIVEHTLRAADWVVGCSEAVLAQGKQLLPDITLNSSVIYNALERPALSPQLFPADGPRLLYLGRLSHEKGVDVAITAFASIAEHFPQVRLIIAGDGPARADLDRQAHELKIRDVVDFAGWIAPSMIPSLINSATLVVMPSRREGLPLVALETALMARPIVASRIGGLPEVVVHEETGLLVEPENPAALGEALASLLDHPETAMQMGQAARYRAQDVFSWERHVNGYDALYRQVITSGRRKLSSSKKN